jgi:hypothetical protein
MLNELIYDSTEYAVPHLVSPGSDQTKLRKSEGNQTEYRVYSVSLSPDDYAETGKSNCSHSVPACVRACVGSPSVGMARAFKSIMESRAKKTIYLQKNRPAFLAQLSKELAKIEARNVAEGYATCVRLNAFSEIRYEAQQYGNIPQRHPNIIFYDYCADLRRLETVRAIPNYHLTGSYKGHHNAEACANALRAGYNVAYVFAQHGPHSGAAAMSQRIPTRWKIGDDWYQCIDGDETDFRFLDKRETRSGRGRIVALRLKSGDLEGRAEAMQSDFVHVID